MYIIIIIIIIDIDNDDDNKNNNNNTSFMQPVSFETVGSFNSSGFDVLCEVGRRSVTVFPLIEAGLLLEEIR